MTIAQLDNYSVCIEATAGSGKTTVMVERIKELILNKNVPPDQCLAITFTDKAAKEMSDRLISVFMKETQLDWPITTVSKIQISTIHSFCQTILKKYALCMGASPHYRVISAIEKQALIHQCIKEMVQKYSHKPNEWMTECLSIWSMDQLNQILSKSYDHRDTINHWLTNGFYDLDDEEKNTVFTTMMQEKYNCLKQFVDEFLVAIEIKKKQDLLLDYDDLLFHTYQLLSNVDWLRHQIQQQKQHIFVDEFQDTSPIQWKIVQLLCDDHDPFIANKLWIVGDRCQAIYGFRGADDQLMEMVLSTKHQQLKHIKNTNNYRSHPIIIRFINQLFQRLFQARNQSFLPMEPKKEASGSASIDIKIVESNTPELEFVEIEHKINHWRSSGYRYSDIAILVRKNYDIKRIKEYFSKKQIPLQLSKGAGLCELDSVQVIICFLQGMLNPNNDVAWYSIATDILGISNTELNEEKECESVKEKVQNLRKIEVKEWEEKIQHGPLDKQLQKCIYELPIKDEWSAQDNQAIQQFLSAFSEMLANTKQPTLEAIKWLEYCIQFPKSMGIDQDSQLDAIQVMTLHAAKGLEFPIVIVPFLDAQFNFGATDPLIISREKGLAISVSGYSKENYIRKEIYSHQKEAGILEELRLFYVTLTRAKQHIFMTGKKLKRKNTSRLSLCLPYLEENEITNQFDFNFNYEHSNNSNPIVTPVENSITHQEITLAHTKSQIYCSFWSISNILDFDTCPKLAALKRYRSLDISKSEDQEKGNKLHHWIAKIIMKKDERHSPEFLQFQSQCYSKKWFNELLENGRFILEYPFEYQYKEHIIRGRFDAIWFDDKQKIMKVLEFKLSIGDNLERYSTQVQCYADILSEKFPEYQITKSDLLLVDFQTFTIKPILEKERDIHSILDQLPKTIGPYNGHEKSCASCPYNEKIENCATVPFMLDS